VAKSDFSQGKAISLDRMGLPVVAHFPQIAETRRGVHAQMSQIFTS
jgi:hypothetical protein